jgi:hypothetical protein
MPYQRKGRCVYKKDTIKKVGCSKAASKAKKYIKALHANVESGEDFNTLVESILKHLQPEITTKYNIWLLN